MKYCSHCGKEVMDTAVICPHCGGALGNANMQTVTGRSRTYSLIMAVLLLIFGCRSLYTNVTSLLDSWAFFVENPVSLMLQLISLCMAIAAICLAGMTLFNKGTAYEKTARPVWLFYIIGNIVGNTISSISCVVDIDADFFDAIKNSYGETVVQRIKYDSYILPACESVFCVIALVMILLAIKRKTALKNKQKAFWLAGSIAPLLHITACILAFVNREGLREVYTNWSDLTKNYIISLGFCVILDAALFIKLSLETVWTDVTLPVPEQADLPAQTNSPVMEVKEGGPKMKYCTHCGKEIMDAAVVCPHCGCPVNGGQAVDNTPSTGLNVVSFLLPLVGLILYLVYHDKAPQKAAAIGKWALIGLVAGIVLSGIYYGAVLSAFL